MNPRACVRPACPATPFVVLFLTATVAFGAHPPAVAGASPDRLSLVGRWSYALDRQDAGVDGRWFARDLEGRIELPGSLPGQGIGDPISANTPWVGGIVDKSFFTAPEYARHREPGRVKVPFWLQPETYYKGVAWYQREIDIPEDWQRRRVVLELERPHWETRVWLDDRFIGSNDSLSTPHAYDLGAGIAPGRHRLTVRVDNRMVVDIGENSHSISDHTQGNWNGIVGRIELSATPSVWIDDLRVYPDAARRTFEVKGVIANGQPGGPLERGDLQLTVQRWTAPDHEGRPSRPQALRFPVMWGPATAEFGWAIPPEDLQGLELWDEFNPVVYQLTATLPNGASRSVTFGLRDFRADGTQFTINGRKTFLRGTLECAIFPKTGHTPTDLESWRKVMTAAKAHGLNNLRFHSHCPPEAAFQVADELGVYLHVECGTWPNQSTTLGDGKPVDAWLYRETDRILKAYGNHPSFVILLHGNEPGGPNHVGFLKKWVEHYRTEDPRRLYSSGAGWPQIPENQLHVTPDPRIQAWGGGLNSRINAKPPETVTDYRDYIAARPVPVVSHEIGQWCVYPNFDEIPKYTGYLKPRNFEIFRESLKARGLLGQARDFLHASGRLQTLCYKEDVESALRTPGMAGFQLLDLHDFPGQGTALVGVLDPFWEGKGYVTPEAFSRFCGPTVPLARLPKRVFTTEETLTAELEVAHFGPEPLRDVAPTFRLVADSGQTLAEGRLSAQDVPVGNGTRLAPLNLDLRALPAPARYRLEIGLEGTPFVNDWDVWVYPPAVSGEVPAGVTVVNDLDAGAERVLAAGGRVLWMLPPGRVANDPRAPVALGFSSIFWNTAWTGRQPPTTLGVLCDPRHPLFRSFPTDAHSNWQWWYLVSRGGALILDDLPRGLRPVVQVIDDWVTNHKLGLVIEARVGKGRLAICSVDLSGELDQDPVRRQFRRSLLDYVGGREFRPRTAITLEAARRLARPPSPLETLGVKTRASSEQPGHEAGLAIDGNSATLWHTFWDEPRPGFPHELTLEFAKPVRLAAVKVLPRQDGNRNGWIKDYAVLVRRESSDWAPYTEGTFGADATGKTVALQEAGAVQGLKLRALSGHAAGPWASVAELELVLAE